MADMAASPGRVARLLRVLPQGGALPEEVWQTRHRGILALLWFHAIVIPPYALIRGFSLLHVLLESLVLPVTAIVATSDRLDRRLRTGAASLGLLSSSAILVHLSGGVIEMHFHFFVMVAVIALYQDWLPFLASIGYVLIHHGLIGALDPDSVYNHMAAWNNPWKWAGIHAFFISGISAACLVTWRLNEQILTQRAAIALDNERLYESERQSRVAMESAQGRLVLLADVGRALTSSLKVDVILRDLAQLVAPSVADFCCVDLLEEDGSLSRIACVADPALRWMTPDLAAEPPDSRNFLHPIVRAIRHERGELLDEATVPSLIYRATYRPADEEAPLENPPRSAIVVPLPGRGAVLGALSVAAAASSGRRLREEDVPLLEELARRAAIAIENARLYSRQRTVAETLQHSLLPERLVEVPGLALAARYISGGPDVDIGGDWYDVLQLPDGSTAVAMGDVAGRGERAASLMGQLRNALRAFSLDGKPPGEVVGRLNHLLYDLGSDNMATMVYAVFEPEAGTLRFVNAGHPPPLVIGPDGAANFLENGGGVPVGAVRQPRYTEAVTTLLPGSTLVLYTDGLVEDRLTPLEEGLARLRDALFEGPTDPEALCDQVLERVLAGRDTKDDAAILAMRLLPLGPRLHLRLPAQSSVLAPLRAVLRRWIASSAASEEDTFDILVATGEACANAIRHGSGRDSSYFELEGFLDGGLTLCVRDGGSWRAPRTSGGGRGLHIIESLMDDVQIDKGATGTQVKMYHKLARAQEGAAP